MAMLHPDDEAFAKQEVLSHASISALFDERLGLVPTSITSPESQGQFHKVYFISLSDADGKPWSGRDVVLRVARKTISKVKTENEMAILKLLRAAGIPVPEVVFFCSDPDNPLQYEYNCLEKILYPPLAEIWPTLSPVQLSRILDQFVDIFAKLFSINVPPNHGSLALDGSSGPVIEETMWQLPDIKRYFHAEPYNLINETFDTINPTESGYASWPAYISAFVKKYHHVISIHPAVDFLRDLLEPLQRLILILDANEAPWVQRLRDEPALRGRLFHRDFHFGNILADHDGTIKAIIDWEFAGIGASFPSRSSLINNCVGYLAYTYSLDVPDGAQVMIDTWEAEFLSRLAERAPAIAATWTHERNRDVVLGVEGEALSNLREYLRSCLEVGVRGVGRVEMARGPWKKVVQDSLKILA
ncbi:kinase-like domain-containing protein [Mycena maculata]|uniref:Kinase-like domain-containing protein n=1 Tax=Mycena maculata TaxID=230809 RepID=A0AAD7HD32_9AGAR|nr:kinase-like domain-containing protein [Mycena maculata]